MDFAALVMRRFLIIVAVALVWAGGGCLQLDERKTLAEEEDLRVRDKNITRNREMLEEKIRRELDHIGLLQVSLKLTRTEEETTTREMEKINEAIAALNKDKAGIEADRAALGAEKAKKLEELKPVRAELVKLQAELGAAKAKIVETQNSTTAEQKRTAAAEEVLEKESKRVEELWLRVTEAQTDLKELEAEDGVLKKGLDATRDRIWKTKELLNEAETALSGDRKKLEEMRKRIDDLLRGEQ